MSIQMIKLENLAICFQTYFLCYFYAQTRQNYKKILFTPACKSLYVPDIFAVVTEPKPFGQKYFSGNLLRPYRTIGLYYGLNFFRGISRYQQQYIIHQQGKVLTENKNELKDGKNTSRSYYQQTQRTNKDSSKRKKETKNKALILREGIWTQENYCKR